MAFKKSSLSKCPLCSSKTEDQMKDLGDSIKDIVQRTLDTGELPRLSDNKLEAISLRLKISPASIRFHIKECVLDGEIKDQRLIELKDMIEAVQTAKMAYMEEPTPASSYAYTGMVKMFLELANSVEGQVDPEVTIEYIVSMVMEPLVRTALLSVAKGFNEMRTNLYDTLPKHIHGQVDSYLKGTLSGVGMELRDSLKEGMIVLAEYHKVELEAKTYKRSLNTVVDDNTALAQEQVTKSPLDNNEQYETNVIKLKL